MNRTKNNITEEDLERLEDIRDEMLELLDEAQDLLRRHGGLTYERARAYWIPHIQTALTRDHEYLGGSMVTMGDTLDELEKALDSDEE